MNGLVTKSTGSWYIVLSDKGEEYSCRARGKFKIKGKKTTNPIAVGDRVAFDLEQPTDKKSGIIHQIDPRTNYIIRKSIHKTGNAHILASNIDQVMIMATLVFPKTSLGFIDRITVAAESFRIPIVLIYNKMDMLVEDQKDKAEDILRKYDVLGYTCLKISALENDGLEGVVSSLSKKKTLLIGQSGVGKSTLINTLNPDISQAIGNVSEAVQKGKHTTTFAQMFELTKDTFIIDTPGIKEFGLVDIGKNELSDYFPEMRHLIEKCKFDNCTHTHEPSCTIADAVTQGNISTTRYESYLSILDDDDNRR